MAECDQVALQLTTRARETLDWQTRARARNQGLVATVG